MASVRQDKVQVKLEILGDQAKTELDNFERKQRLINDELKLMKKGTDEYIQKSKELKDVSAQVDALRGKLGTAGMTVNQLDKYSKQLNRELKNLTPGTQEFVNKSAELNKVNSRLGEVRRQVRGVDSELEKSKGGFGKFASSVMGMLGPLGVTMGGIFALGKVKDFVDDSIKNFNRQSQAVAQLDAALKSTGNAAGLTSEELQKLASERQGKTLFGDEATIEAQSLLLTFTNIKKGVFEEAIPAIQDMATRMAGDGPADMKGASIQLGKALNDPIKGISALSKVGVSFTEEQKSTIKTMVEMGDTAGAQTLILEELNKEFGGSAEAARKAGTGGFQAFMNTMGDVQEMIGEKIAIGLNRMGNFLDEVVSKSEPVVVVFREFWGELGKMYDEVYEVIDGLGIFSEEGSAAETVVKILTTAVTIILTPIKLLAQVIGGIATGFKNLYNSSELVRGSLGGFAAFAVQVFSNLKKAALDTLGGLADLITGIFSGDLGKIKEGLKKTAQGVGDAYLGLGKGAGKAFQEGYENQKDKLIPDSKPKPEEVEAEKAAAVAKAEAVVNAETDAQKKAREKAEKEAEKLRQQRLKEELDAEKKIQDIKILLIENETDRKIAAAELQARRETAAVVGTTEQRNEQIRLIEQKLQRDIAQIRKDGTEAEEKRLQEAAAKELDIRNRNAKAVADLEVLRASKGSDAAYEQALLSQMEVERDIQLQNTQLTADEKLLIEAEYEQRKLDIKKDFAEAAAQLERNKHAEAIGYMQSATQQFFDFKKLGTDREMAKADKDKQRRLQSLESEYKAGKISKEQFEGQKNAIETNYDAKARQIKRKAAEDEKVAKIADATMAGILAVIKAAPNVPLQIATGIMAALNVAKIVATPLPTFAKGGIIGSAFRGIRRKFAKGGSINPVAGVPDAGQLHANGGIKMTDGATGEYLGEWERGEPYMILSRNTYANNKGVIDALLDSSLYRNGAPIKKNGGIYAESGAVVGGGTIGSSVSAASDGYAELISEVRAVKEGIDRIPRNIRAYMVYADIEEAAADMEAVRADAAS